MGAATAGDPAAFRARRGNLYRAAPRGRNESGARRARLYAPPCECLGRLYHQRHAAYFLFRRVGVRILAGNHPALTGLAGARRRLPRAGVWELAGARRAVAGALREPATRFFAVVFALPFGFFAVLSAVKLIGLHWMLAFVPYFFVAAGRVLSREQLRRSVLYLGTFSAIHVAAIVAAAMLPLETWKSTRFYDGIVYHARMPEILRELKPYGEEFEFAADGYSMSAVASFHTRAHVAVC